MLVPAPSSPALWSIPAAVLGPGGQQGRQSGRRGGGQSASSLLASAAVLAPAVAVCRRVRRSLRYGAPRIVPLLPDEAGSIMMLPSITTVTFYEGEPPASLLRDMTETLLAANPWLGGQLRRDRASGSTVLWVPADAPHATSHFTETSRRLLTKRTPLQRMRQLLEDVTVPPGVDCIDNSTPLFRVSVVTIAPGRFAVVISLSHVLGDGFTYYRIYGALDQREKEIGGTVYPAGEGPARVRLNPMRKLEFPAAMAQTLGMEKVAWLNSRRARWGSMLDRNLRSRHRWSAWEVDTAWVEEEKRRQSSAESFVSTNDVLTSSFLSSGKFAYGVMSVNFRGRLCGLDKIHAGRFRGSRVPTAASSSCRRLSCYSCRWDSTTSGGGAPVE
ncbi:unnamed protein product [Symbiodinium sp. CCMP2592]|nr:unnamed protein product [Symbiodinium sp. CCMP2592]